MAALPNITFRVNDTGAKLPQSIQNAIEVLTDEVRLLRGQPLYRVTADLTLQAYFVERCIRQRLNLLFPDQPWDLLISYRDVEAKIPGSFYLHNRSHFRLSSGERFAPELTSHFGKLIRGLPDTRPEDFREIVLLSDRSTIEQQWVIIGLLVMTCSVLAFLQLSTLFTDPKEI